MVKDKIEYLGEGRHPPENGYETVVSTPSGLYPKLIDVALKYKIFKASVHRRCKSTHRLLASWFVISNPTEDQSYEALENANTLFTDKYEAEDNCMLCTHVDDLIFPEECWLLSVKHRHGYLDAHTAVILYSYRGRDYRVLYKKWLDGDRPHLDKLKLMRNK